MANAIEKNHDLAAEPRTYRHYFTQSWQPVLSRQEAFRELITNLSWEQMVARPVKDGRDFNGKIAPFQSQEQMWKFIRSYAKLVS